MDGILVINKPKNCTSHDIVYKIKKIFGEKVGHTGTLDPNATGVLPILIGNGTKLSKYLIDHDKTYIATIQLGIKTDTADSEGIEIEKRNVPQLQKTEVINALNMFLGKQIQTPPIYSAIKVKGKKLYEYARKGQEVEIPKREIQIYSIELKEIREMENQIIIKVDCSKGTYIRSLCEDIAEKLGTVGYMKELQRTKVGQFKLENSITIEQLEENKNNDLFLKNNIITMQELLKQNQSIKLTSKELEMFYNGVKLNKEYENGIYTIYTENTVFVGTGIVENNKLKRDIVQ